MISEHILKIPLLNEPELIFFIQLNGSTYFYLIWIILFNYLFEQFYVFMYYNISLTIQLNNSRLFTHR